MDGPAAGTVIASCSKLPEGAHVLDDLGWREYATVHSAQARPIDTSAAHVQDYFGVLDMTGITAYVGLPEIAPYRTGTWSSSPAPPGRWATWPGRSRGGSGRPG